MQPSSGDVFIASPPKCGTTWVCQLVQTLRSRGDMSFEVRRCAKLCCACCLWYCCRRCRLHFTAAGLAVVERQSLESRRHLALLHYRQHVNTCHASARQLRPPLFQSCLLAPSFTLQEINLVIPCIEMAWDGGYKDLQAPQASGASAGNHQWLAAVLSRCMCTRHDATAGWCAALAIKGYACHASPRSTVLLPAALEPTGLQDTHLVRGGHGSTSGCWQVSNWLPRILPLPPGLLATRCASEA